MNPERVAQQNGCNNATIIGPTPFQDESADYVENMASRSMSVMFGIRNFGREWVVVFVQPFQGCFRGFSVSQGALRDPGLCCGTASRFRFSVALGTKNEEEGPAL